MTAGVAPAASPGPRGQPGRRRRRTVGSVLYFGVRRRPDLDHTASEAPVLWLVWSP